MSIHNYAKKVERGMLKYWLKNVVSTLAFFVWLLLGIAFEYYIWQQSVIPMFPNIAPFIIGSAFFVPFWVIVGIGLFKITKK